MDERIEIRIPGARGEGAKAHGRDEAALKKRDGRDRSSARRCRHPGPVGVTRPCPRPSSHDPPYTLILQQGEPLFNPYSEMQRQDRTTPPDGREERGDPVPEVDRRDEEQGDGERDEKVLKDYSGNGYKNR